MNINYVFIVNQQGKSEHHKNRNYNILMALIYSNGWLVGGLPYASNLIPSTAKANTNQPIPNETIN